MGPGRVVAVLMLVIGREGVEWWVMEVMTFALPRGIIRERIMQKSTIDYFEISGVKTNDEMHGMYYN